MKIGGKLVLGFVAVALLGASMGGFGIFNMRRIDAADIFLYEKMTAPLGAVADFVGSTNRMRANAIMIVLHADEPDFVEEDSKKIVSRKAIMDQAKDVYRPTLLDENDRKLFAQLEELDKAFRGEVDEVVALEARPLWSVEKGGFVCGRT